MISRILDQTTIIVRHCGERTTDACAELLKQLAPDNTIHRVSARPFHAVLRQSLALGIGEGRPWTLCIDADVLILPEIAKFLSAVENFPPGIFEAQALVLDKLIPTRRPAGNHLYRTELIARALPVIPVSDSLRPESDMIKAMAATGYRAYQSPLLIGLHDFEQTHRDIYMKAFLHGHKHRFLMPLLRPIWETLSQKDDDFRVALTALDDALGNDESPQLRRDFREQRVEEALARLDLTPKSPLQAISPMDVSGILRTAAAMLNGETRNLVDKIQTSIDAVVFPHEVPPLNRGNLFDKILRAVRGFRRRPMGHGK